MNEYPRITNIDKLHEENEFLKKKLKAAQPRIFMDRIKRLNELLDLSEAQIQRDQKDLCDKMKWHLDIQLEINQELKSMISEIICLIPIKMGLEK